MACILAVASVLALVTVCQSALLTAQVSGKEVQTLGEMMRHQAAAKSRFHILNFIHGSTNNREGPPCRQNAGRACTPSEQRRPYLSISQAALMHNDTRDLVYANSTTLLRLARFDPALTHGKVGKRRWAFLNPSTVQYAGSMWVFMRCKGQEWKKALECPDDSPYATRPCIGELTSTGLQINFMCHTKVNAKFRVVSEVKAIDSRLPYDVVWQAMQLHPNTTGYIGFGSSDPRAFVWDNTVYVTFNALPSDDMILKGRYRNNQMYVQAVLPEIGPAVQLRLKGIGEATSREKNWSPIDEIVDNRTASGETNFLFSRSVEPHEVLQCSKAGQCESIASSSRKQYFSSLMWKYKMLSMHLGSNAVRIDEWHYGAIFHAMHRPEHDPLRPTYLNFFYLFQDQYPYTITHVSKQPLAMLSATYHQDGGRHFEFVSGLSFVDGYLLISYGFDDMQARFHLVTVTELLSMLEEI